MMKRRTAGSDQPDHSTPIRFLAGLGLVRVVGRSMEPTLHAGELLLVRRTCEPRPGRLVVVWLPGSRPLSIKRVVRREPEGWWVERDNPREGVDSWAVGAISDAAMVAQVLVRLWPPSRLRASA
jgi:phage repressor protein C with HTH and peptisase S24 domain